MPSFRPIRPSIAIVRPSSLLLELDLHVDARGEVELAEGVDRLLRGLEDVEQALVGADLELLARLLVDVGGPVHGEALDVGWQRNRPRDPPARATYGVDDLAHRLIEQPVIVRLQPNADLVVHSFTRRSWSPRRRPPSARPRGWRSEAPRPSRSA